MAIDLKDVSRSEVTERFLRSSPKVKIFFRKSIGGADNGNSASIQKSDTGGVKQVSWTCKICSYNNQIKSNYDFSNETPKCTSCGIKGNTAAIKAKIQESMQHNNVEDTVSIISTGSSNKTQELPDKRDDQCSQCTFINHPSMKYCEMCGSELKSKIPSSLTNKLSSLSENSSVSDIGSVNSLNIQLESEEQYSSSTPYIKLSFRKGGETKFQDHLITALDELKWESLKERGGVNQNGVKIDPSPEIQPKTIKGGGIFGLEQIGEQQRQRNEIILRNSLDDLEQLMFRFQDLMKLSSSLKKFVNKSTTTQINSNVIPPLSISKSSSLYLQELSRHISEYLINCELTRKSSMITSHDLFAKYNRYLISTQGFGTELISTQDFNKAIEMFKDLNLSINMKNYEKSGLVVLSLARTDSTNIYEEFILQFIEEQEYQLQYTKLKSELMGIQNEYLDNEYNHFKGVTISEVSNKYEWSHDITAEEIEKCVENGTVVIDQDISGTFYFVNRFERDDLDIDGLRKQIEQELHI